MCVHHVCAGACRGRKGHWVPCSWSYRWFWATWYCCWEPNCGHLQEQQGLLPQSHLSGAPDSGFLVFFLRLRKSHTYSLCVYLYMWYVLYPFVSWRQGGREAVREGGSEHRYHSAAVTLFPSDSLLELGVPVWGTFILLSCHCCFLPFWPPVAKGSSSAASCQHLQLSL